MAKLRRYPGASAVAAVVAVCAFSTFFTAGPAAAAEPVAEPAGGWPAMTPVPRTGVTIMLPSGAVITLPASEDAAMPHEKNGDHVVGEELC